MAQIGINCRATSTWVTDAANQDYSLGTTTLRSLNGFSHAWASTATSRDRTVNSDYAPELSGINYQTNVGTTTLDFVVTLPAIGQYDIAIALGDATFSRSGQTCSLYDNTTLLATIVTNGSTPIGSFFDITGTLRTGVQWRAERTTARYTFATTTLKVRIGGGSGADITTLSHLYLASVSSPLPVSRSLLLGVG